jgi:hypothetical protein
LVAEWRPTPRGPRIDLVQCYDEAIISYTESRHVLATDGVAFSALGGRGGFPHIVLADGQLLGQWRVKRTRTGAVVETRLARPIDAREQAALTAAVERYEKFLRT